MRIMVCASACFFGLSIAGCGGSGGSGGTGGTTAATTTGTGGSGGATTGTTGGAGGTGGSGGSGGMAGSGGSTTTGTMTSTKAAFGQTCAMDTDCQDGLVCFNFNSKGMLCTNKCTTDADCKAPSTGCNGMGYCKPN